MFLKLDKDITKARKTFDGLGWVFHFDHWWDTHTHLECWRRGGAIISEVRWEFVPIEAI